MSDGHVCEMCKRALNEQECEILDNLSDLEGSVPKETLYSIVYIAGYVIKGSSSIDDTLSYYEK